MALKQLNSVLPLIGSNFSKNEQIIFLSHNYLLISLSTLKKHVGLHLNLLSSISGVDHLQSRYRFSSVYELLSVKKNFRLRLKVFINEITPINSAVSIFVNANWWEREIWDLYGIYHKNHPDLRRILTDYGFEGFPFRKDFPLSGFIELRYDLLKKRVNLEAVELTQDFRFFGFESPWQ